MKDITDKYTAAYSWHCLEKNLINNLMYLYKIEVKEKNTYSKNLEFIQFLNNFK